MKTFLMTLTYCPDLSPACIRNPDQEVHLLNGYGISALDSSTYSGVEVCAPVAYDESKEVVRKDGTSGTITTAGPDAGMMIN